ncbi:glycine zipper family protein [Kovacikia minuta CCNUW1]|uniref:glycine zipper family protein n=1 Tax=Kovacikia minuta TaxID=2931930 RepID=UPI001CCBACB4|nr:glycine zipper family protein [Kovacikia minuta CCNUW1]
MSRDQEKRDRRLETDADKSNINPDANPDPITGEPGAHPVGTGIGAAAAGAIGTAIGAAGGPVGAAVGAVVGSVVGGLAGKAAAESIDPTIEDAYWRENYASRPYAKTDRTYEDYSPAYRTGYEGYGRYYDQGTNYEDIEPELRRNYEANYSATNVGWEDAKYAVQDAWDRVRNNSLFNDEDDYWRQNYNTQPYYERNMTYDRYQPAYQTGYEGYVHYQNQGKTYDEVEPELQRNYERNYGSSGLGWDKAKHAVRDAWYRLDRTFKNRR